MATILKLAIKNIYPNYQHYTDIKSVLGISSSSHRGCVILERKKSGSDQGSFITL
jgi:hypothetical protein